MGASFRYASVDSLDVSWLPLSRFESRAVGVAVYGCMGEGEANGGDDGMAVGPMGVGSDRTSVRNMESPARKDRGPGLSRSFSGLLGKSRGRASSAACPMWDFFSPFKRS
jgi:hypothetical protein